MKPDESLYWKDWFRIGAKDFARVQRCLNANDLEDAAFHLQQSLEKYLKGFLLFRNWRLQRHHNVIELPKEAVKHVPELAEFRELCQEVSQYYTLERYPLFVDLHLDTKELRAAIAKSKEMIALLKRSVPKVKPK